MDDTLASVRVFLVDDHDMVRDGVRLMLEAVDDIVVVGEAATAEAAIGRILLTRPDVAVLDVNLPDRSGIEVCRELRDRAPEIKSLMLTSHDEDEALFDAILAGAAGYVMKNVRGNQLVEFVRRVAKGESLIDHEAAAHLQEQVDSGSLNPALARLSNQERRTLELLAKGMTNQEIAEEMILSDKTVKNYVSNLLMKLGMSRRSEAAAYAARIEARRESYLAGHSEQFVVKF